MHFWINAFLILLKVGPLFHMSATATSFSISLRNAVSALLPSNPHGLLRFPCAHHRWPGIPYPVEPRCFISFFDTNPAHMHLLSFLMKMPAYTSLVNLQTQRLCVSGMLHTLKERSMGENLIINNKATSFFFPSIFPIIFLCSDAYGLWTKVCLEHTLVNKYYFLSL